jgi:hypothetical protein
MMPYRAGDDDGHFLLFVANTAPPILPGLRAEVNRAVSSSRRRSGRAGRYGRTSLDVVLFCK